MKKNEGESMPIQSATKDERESNFLIPPESITNFAFQYENENYNLRVNTCSGIITLSRQKENVEIPQLIKLLT